MKKNILVIVLVIVAVVIGIGLGYLFTSCQFDIYWSIFQNGLL